MNFLFGRIHFDEQPVEAATLDLMRHAVAYDKVTPGGFVTVDDYGAIAACRVAVDEFRRERGITSRLRWCDWMGVFWQKEA